MLLLLSCVRFQVHVWPSVTRSNHLVVYAPLSFSPPFLSVSYVLIVLVLASAAALGAVVSRRPFASVSAGSPPLGVIFGDLSDNKYPLRDAGHQPLLALSSAYYYCARSNTDCDLQLFHSSCWLLLFSIHCAQGSPSLCTLV